MAPTGPNLVIAGAGSGKTHTLTYRVAYLLDRGVDPSRILLLTFTNKAARNMTDRVSHLISGDIKRLWSGTFHSIGNRIIRQYSSHLGLPQNYTIMDSEDAGTLMNAVLAESTQNAQLQTRFPRGTVLAKILSMCINTQRSVADILETSYPYFLELADPIRDIFALYLTRKLEMGVVDYDDLLLLWKRLLTEVPSVRHELEGRFEHVLVDEYQDTNLIQGEIVDLMVSRHRNLMVVGDDCQAIYGFRGAEYRNILEFPLRYPDCRQFRLEINYRSTPQILDLANRSIAMNPGQFPKTLTPSRPDGPRPAKVKVRDVYQQAAFVCQRMLELADEGISLSDTAVLYRSHHHSMELQVEMTRRGIPYVVRSGVRFFEQAHIKDVLAYLRFLHNPKDELSFLRLARHFPGIGTQRAQQIWRYVQSGADPLKAVSDEELLASLPARARQGWSQASPLFAELRKKRLMQGPANIVQSITTGPYNDHLRREFAEDYESRKGDLEQLASYAAQFDDIDRFLGEITLMSSVSGQDIAVGGQQPDEYVTLSSIHQAKGLEWHACFVLWLSDGHFPSASSLESPEGEEEERRLFYVAVTRAKQELYLCHVFTHIARDRRAVLLRESVFLSELALDGLRDEDNPFESWELEES